MKSYKEARAFAQKQANDTGYDFGLELNSLFKTYSVRMLPCRENRYGFELRCEVVMCEHIDRCRSGHGPAR